MHVVVLISLDSITMKGGRCSKSKHTHVRVYLLEVVPDEIKPHILFEVKGERFTLVKVCSCAGFDDSNFLDSFGLEQCFNPQGTHNYFVEKKHAKRLVRGRELMNVVPQRDGIIVSTHSLLSKTEGCSPIVKPVTTFTIATHPRTRRESIMFEKYVDMLDSE